MASVNKLILVGNLGADPEMRWLPSGDAVANFSVATHDRRSDGKGGYLLVTEWHRVALYGKQAEVARDYLKKGSQIYVEGKLRTGTWTDREGVVRRTWTVHADRMQMLGKPDGRASNPTQHEEDEMTWFDSPPAIASGGGASSPPTADDAKIPF